MTVAQYLEMAVYVPVTAICLLIFCDDKRWGAGLLFVWLLAITVVALATL